MVEFSLILPFFLGVLFIIYSFVMMMALGPVTFFSTFMAARAASVNSSTYESAASQVMPGIDVDIALAPSNTQLMARGEYDMRPFLTGGGGALSNPLRNYLTLRSNVEMHKWPTCTGVGDNAIDCP